MPLTSSVRTAMTASRRGPLGVAPSLSALRGGNKRPLQGSLNQHGLLFRLRCSFHSNADAAFVTADRELIECPLITGPTRKKCEVCRSHLSQMIPFLVGKATCSQGLIVIRQKHDQLNEHADRERHLAQCGFSDLSSFNIS